MSRLIDADALERDGWQISRTVQIDKNTMEFQTRKPTDFPQKEIIFEDIKKYCEKRRLVILEREFYDEMKRTLQSALQSAQPERREKMEMTFTIEDADLDKLNNVLKDINVRECPWFEVHDKHGNKAKYYREPHWIPVTERLPDEDGYSMYDFDDPKSACSDCQEFDCYGCEHKEETK